MKPAIETTSDRPAAPTITAIDAVTVEKWRVDMGYSVRDAAIQLGCSRDAFTRWQREGGAPRYIGLAMSALALGMETYNAPAPKLEEIEQ